MNNIYDLHDKAFPLVSAYVLMNEGERVATLAFKFPKDGAGRLWCYFHYIGAEMVRGYAGGYGYDKQSAAVQAAMNALKHKAVTYPDQPWDVDNTAVMNAQLDKFKAMFKNIGGKDWADVLRDNNIQALKAV